MCSVDPIADVSWHKLKQQVKVGIYHDDTVTLLVPVRLMVSTTMIKLEVVGGAQVCMSTCIL